MWQLVEQRQHYNADTDEWGAYKHGDNIYDVQAACQACERDCRDVLAEQLPFYDEHALQRDPLYKRSGRER